MLKSKLCINGPKIHIFVLALFDYLSHYQKLNVVCIGDFVGFILAFLERLHFSFRNTCISHVMSRTVSQSSTALEN